MTQTCGPVLDSDIIIKISAYGIAVDVLRALSTFGQAAALSLARIVIPKQITRSGRIFAKGAALAELNSLFGGLQFLEPDDRELALAAEFETEAIARNLMLDPGESQILAVVTTRAAALMVTGDKRAIEAIEVLVSSAGLAAECANRIVCLEQVATALLESVAFDRLRKSICQEPDVDKVLAICFSCKSDAPTANDAAKCLESYVRAVRNSAPNVLFSKSVVA